MNRRQFLQGAAGAVALGIGAAAAGKEEVKSPPYRAYGRSKLGESIVGWGFLAADALPFRSIPFYTGDWVSNYPELDEILGLVHVALARDDFRLVHRVEANLLYLTRAALRALNPPVPILKGLRLATCEGMRWSPYPTILPDGKTLHFMPYGESGLLITMKDLEWGFAYTSTAQVKDIRAGGFGIPKIVEMLRHCCDQGGICGDALRSAVECSERPAWCVPEIDWRQL